jgi:hypothetical protein
MSNALASARRRALYLDRVNAAAFGAVGCLHLAAAPTFAVMAVLTGADGGGSSPMVCSAAHDASPLGGMATMYLLMSVFHCPPWLKLIFGRRASR